MVNMRHWLRELLPHMPHYGYVLVFIVVFLNNIGFPLPGETILLGAGFVLGRSAGSLWESIAAGAVACFLGGICSFWMGRKLGHSGLERIRWLHLTPDRMKWPDRFFKRHGAKTVFIARFIALFPPVVANLLAGMSKIPWRIYQLLCRQICHSVFDGQRELAARAPGSMIGLPRFGSLSTALNQRGFASGTPDGMMGPATRDWLRRYQRSVGLPADGYPTLDVLQRLQEQ
jgi:membrane protein YqaA with SNARE-associated domain